MKDIIKQLLDEWENAERGMIHERSCNWDRDLALLAERRRAWESKLGLPAAGLEGKANASGTCLQGYVEVSYNRLVEVFGEPHWRHGDKSTVEWAFRDPKSGICFTLYDYKWQSCQNDTVESFHVGGHDYRSLKLVEELLGVEGQHSAR
jgi:hypothetical protein